MVGGAAIDASGSPLPPRTIDACRTSAAVLLGAVGGPRWSDPAARVRPEQGLLEPSAFIAVAEDSGFIVQLGEWVLRSTDGGKTWSPPIPTIVNSPHGPTQLKDGRLLYVGKELWKSEGRIGVAESKDDGLTWSWLSEIPTRPGDEVKKGYHELFAIETDDGRIVTQIRNHNKPDAGTTLQCESSDGGRTWTVPKSIDVWGLPSQLLKLKDGRLLMTYGHRRKPFGNQARISTDHGRTWSAPMIVSGDGTTGDLGYPATVELADGTLLTVWYENMKDLGKAVLRQAKWKISQ
jgi:photosystem II stability/assembly factor-like uncharacterized protein